MTASEKGISAHQIHLMFGLSRKSAWFMCHRIREAANGRLLPKLAGIVEADETCIAPKPKRGHPTHRENVKDEIEQGLRPKPWRKEPYQDKTTVLEMVERGGTVVSRVIPKATGEHVKPVMSQMIDLQDAVLVTDGHPVYRGMRALMSHMTINHDLEYVRGAARAQTIEGYWSLVKQYICGTLHHVGGRLLADVPL